MVKTAVANAVKKAWILLVILAVILVAGFVVTRLRGIFGAHDNRPITSGSADDIKPFNPKHVVYEVYGSGAIGDARQVDGFERIHDRVRGCGSRVVGVDPDFMVAVEREVGCGGPGSYQRMIAEPVDADFDDQLAGFEEAGVFVREKPAFDHQRVRGDGVGNRRP